MIVIDYYWLLVYRLSTSGIITEQRNLIIFCWYLNMYVPVMIAFLAYSSVFVMDPLFQDKVLVLSTFGKKLSSWFFHFICHIKAGKLYLKGNTFGAYNLQTASGEFYQYFTLSHCVNASEFRVEPNSFRCRPRWWNSGTFFLKSLVGNTYWCFIVAWNSQLHLRSSRLFERWEKFAPLLLLHFRLE